MALCEQCGSIQIVRARPRLADRLVTFLTSKRPFICRRCGWRGRRDWTDQDLLDLSNYGASGAEPDPVLALLDAAPGQKSRKSKKKKSQKAAEDHPKRGSQGLDLGQLDLAGIAAGPAEASDSNAPHRRSSRGQRHRSKRRKSSRRREIVATIAVTALVMFLVVILGLTGSCGGGGTEGF